jgi:hypothetical protein
MLYEISVDYEDNIKSSTVDTLSTIDLNEDIIICCPYYEKAIVQFDNNGFVIRNADVLRIDQATSQFEFWPLVKIATPKSVVPFVRTNVKGLRIIDEYFNTSEGINIEQELSVFDKIINFDTVTANYTLYNSMIFSLKSNQNKLFKNDVRFRGMQISKFTDLMKMTFMNHVTGERLVKVKNIYIINYKLIFDGFPNFSNFKQEK